MKLSPCISGSSIGNRLKAVNTVTAGKSTERAELVQKLSSDVIEAYKCGLFTKEQAVAELKDRGEELGVYTKV